MSIGLSVLEQWHTLLVFLSAPHVVHIAAFLSLNQRAVSPTSPHLSHHLTFHITSLSTSPHLTFHITSPFTSPHFPHHLTSPFTSPHLSFPDRDFILIVIQNPNAEGAM
jgi:hypothetical protein